MGIPSITYVPQFFMTGFLYSFPFDMVVRIWDSFWLRRFDFFYAVAVSVFKITQSITLSLEMDQMMMFLKFKDGGREDFDTEQLILAASVMFSKFKPSLLRAYENEAREIITGVKNVPTILEKPKNRNIVKKFSSSITHAATPRGRAQTADSGDPNIAINKPSTARKTRKTATVRRARKNITSKNSDLTEPEVSDNDVSISEEVKSTSNLPVVPPRRTARKTRGSKSQPLGDTEEAK